VHATSTASAVGREPVLAVAVWLALFAPVLIPRAARTRVGSPAPEEPRAAHARSRPAARAEVRRAGARPDSARLVVRDLTPKFRRFYDSAVAANLDEEARWALWKAEYGMAAVPPTPQGRATARARLDSVWDRYAGLMPGVPKLAAGEARLARRTLPEIAKLLGADGDTLGIGLVLFVGQFSNNAFTVPASDGRPPTVVLPVEAPDPRLTLTHELTHAVHESVGHLRNGYGAPLGQTLLMEGLAMHVARRLDPGHPDRDYTPAKIYGPRWLDRCTSHAAAILKGLQPYVADAGPKTAERFTTGSGTTGLHDEVYCAGWVLVGRLLASGETYASLARVPESEMSAFVREAIARGGAGS